MLLELILDTVGAVVNGNEGNLDGYGDGCDDGAADGRWLELCDGRVDVYNVG